MFSFQFTHTPSIHFGPGKFGELPGIIEKKKIKKLVLITGGASFRNTDLWQHFVNELKSMRIELKDYSISGEPDPDTINSIAGNGKDFQPDCILAIGGGSVLDAGKAVSAMIPEELPVEQYLEGIGTEQPTGDKIFYIAVPTTSGTGSETTKNAVISRTGENGFKKSLRHDSYVPNIALIDPKLMLSCPKEITAASGLDAITQLVEGFVSSKSSPLTDSLAISGLMTAGRSFERAVEQGESDIEARTHMAYAACMSGIVLANAGLGIIHGIAGYAGGRFSISHGVACGTLLAKATDVIIDRLFDLEEENNIPLIKYAESAKYLSGRDLGSVEKNCGLLVDQFYLWTEKYEIPVLSSFGISEDDCHEIAVKSGLKNTPVDLSAEDIQEICLHRL